MTSFRGHIRGHVRMELDAAQTCAKRDDFAASFRHLERAHVLGQNSTREHVRVHGRMLLWAIRQFEMREIVGQVLRIVGAAMTTAIGLVPQGNTGGTNVSPFHSMPISEDLAVILAHAPNRSGAKIRAIALFVLFALGTALWASVAMAEQTRTVIADGHRVAFRVMGSGRPAIVLISGLGDGLKTFQDVARDLAKTNTVIIYDRAGYGGSDVVNGSRDASAAERELFSLLAQSGVEGPYVLAGHSLGGLFAEYYAAKHPDQVSGLILEESRPAGFTRRCETALGAGKCLPPAWLAWLMPKGARGEAAALQRSVMQVEGSMPLSGKPVLILSRPSEGKKAPFDALWTETQKDLAARYPSSRHLIAASGGHYLHVDQRDWFLSSVRHLLVELNRTGQNNRHQFQRASAVRAGHPTQVDISSSLKYV